MDRNTVFAAATELYRQRNYPQVVAACRAELGSDPAWVELRLLLSRALMALRRDAEAQLEVAAVLRHQPKAPDAYQLLGELAFRRDELRAAEIFLREAIRLRAEDAHSKTLLEIIGAMNAKTTSAKPTKQPAAAAAKLPAASAAAGPFARSSSPVIAPEAHPTEPSEMSFNDDEPTANVASFVESVALRLNPGSTGFGEYLVYKGVIDRAQLFNVLHLHHARKYRLGAAVVKLGYANAERVEKLARRYHRALSDHGIPLSPEQQAVA